MRPEHSKAREDCIDKATKELKRKVTQFQRILSGNIIDFLTSEITFVGGRAVVNNSNIRKVEALNRIYDEAKTKSPILKHVINNLVQLQKDNEKYFSKVAGEKIKVTADDVYRSIMLRLGYDVNKGQVITNGFLSAVLNSDDPLTAIKEVALRAIISGLSLSDLKKDVQTAIEGSPDSLGAIERHLNTHMYDIYQQFDRETGRLLAEKLDLKYAIYQGGLIKTSRPFCIERNNRVFTREEIATFGTKADKYGGYSSKEIGYFQGKPEIYSPFLDLGGYNCRHQLDWLSNELGEVLYKQQEEDDKKLTGQKPAPAQPKPPGPPKGQKKAMDFNKYGNIQKDVDTFEKEIFGLPKERGGLWDKDGVLLDVVDGSKRQISVAHWDGFRAAAINSTFTHNHPSWPDDPTKEGNSFSKPDILTALNYGLREMRAVTGGAVYRMIFEDEFQIGGAKFKKGQINQSTLPLIFKRMNQVERGIRAKLMSEARRRLGSDQGENEKLLNELGYRHWHLVWTEFIKGTKGITYIKEKRNFTNE